MLGLNPFPLVEPLKNIKPEYKEAKQRIGSETYDDVVHLSGEDIKKERDFKEMNITKFRETEKFRFHK